MRISFILFLLIMAGSTIVHAQNNNEGMYQEFRKMPVAPSPEASAIGKFGDIPVSLSTGIPSISIPFYSFHDKLNNLGLSVGINYHAGGHKVEDMASSVGLGWSLSAGGVISRTMRGRPDDGTYGYLNTDPLPQYYTGGYDKVSTRAHSGLSINEGICYANASGDFMTVKGVAESTLDGESDIYQFSIGNISGKFFFDKNGKVQLVSPSNVKITFSYASGTPNYNIEEFIVTDQLGVKYYFNEKEYTETASSISGGPSPVSAYASSWYISKIVSADGQSEILFNYSSYSTLSYEGGFSDSHKTVESNGFTSTVTQSHNVITLYYAKRLNSISFPDGTALSFQYNFSRLDYSGSHGLTEVKIKNGNKEKKFLLNYGYFESNTCGSFTENCTPPLPGMANDYYKRLKLLSVTESDGTLSLPAYTFEYNSTKLPVRNSKSQDWWGYYNGQGANQTLASTVPVPSYSGGYILGGDRTPSEEFTKAWVLEKINFPTGGNSRFYYELNDGYNGTTYRSIGGLRVQRTEDYEPATGKTMTTVYSYKKEDNTSSGSLQTLPNYSYYWSTYERLSEMGGVIGVDYFLTETSTPSQSLSYYNGSPVIYTRVKQQKINGTETLGHSVYEYTSFSSMNAYDTDYPFVYKQDFDWQQGLLLKEAHYNNSNSLLKSVVNEYDFFTFPTNPINNPNSRNMIAGLLCSDDKGTVYGHYVYGARSYYLRYGRADLKKTTTKVAGQSGAFQESVVEHTYYTSTSHALTDISNYTLPATTKTKNSKLEDIETKYYYPFNYSTTGLSQKTALINANRIGETISTETWKKVGGTNFLTGAMVNDYSIVNSTMLKQHKAIVLETSAPINQSVVGLFDQNNLLRHAGFKDQLVYTAFDIKGRFTEVQTQGQETNSVMWGKSNAAPVCVVKNATNTEVAYSSFEEDGNFGWQNITGSFIVTAKGVTGVKYYQSSSISIQKAGLNSAKKYIVSYWSKNGALTVSGTQTGWPLAGRTTTVKGQSWTYYQHLVTGVSSVTVSSSTTCAIDELRLYPQTSEMNTVAYNPLTGVTEQADANGNIVYYEYDGFFRLSMIRDFQAKIIKKICYNYAGQTEACDVFYNVVKTGNFTKANCSGGTGSTVTYTVAEGVYSASSQPAADALAQNDVDANGQAYANQHGTCIFSSSSYSGTYYSTACSGEAVPEPIYVNVPAGMFTSSVSLQDANSQALAYAQNYANIYGTCANNVNLYGQNDVGDDVYIILTNTSTYQQYFLYMSPFAWYGQIGTVPPGNYDVEMGPSGFGYINYSAGCSNFSSGYNAFFYNITINSSCNTFNFY